jgi:predicted DNA-binding protein
MDKSNKSEAIPLRVTPELKKKLLTLADKDHRTLSDYVRLQLETLVANKK